MAAVLRVREVDIDRQVDILIALWFYDGLDSDTESYHLDESDHLAVACVHAFLQVTIYVPVYLSKYTFMLPPLKLS